MRLTATIWNIVFLFTLAISTADAAFPLPYQASATGATNPISKSVIIYADAKFYNELSDEIGRLASDISSDLGVLVDVFGFNGNTTTPKEIRDTLRRHYDENRLTGVIFIGDVPLAKVEKRAWGNVYCSACSDITYFEDLDEGVIVQTPPFRNAVAWGHCVGG